MDQVAYIDLSISASAQAIHCFAYLFYYGRLGSASAQLSNHKRKQQAGEIYSTSHKKLAVSFTQVPIKQHA
nr:hypothetical protein Itr_chr15CG05930 [Ipomoea trifida]